jgi:hypothetical protein
MWMFSVGWAKRSVPNNQPSRSWARFALPNLLALFMLFAQAGALAHGVSHLGSHDHDAPGGDPVCEQCLVYAPLGAGALSHPLLWQAPVATYLISTPPVVTSTFGFRATYQSRAPPLTC